MLKILVVIFYSLIIIDIDEFPKREPTRLTVSQNEKLIFKTINVFLFSVKARCQMGNCLASSILRCSRDYQTMIETFAVSAFNAYEKSYCSVTSETIHSLFIKRSEIVCCTLYVVRVHWKLLHAFGGQLKWKETASVVP